MLKNKLSSSSFIVTSVFTLLGLLPITVPSLCNISCSSSPPCSTAGIDFVGITLANATPVNFLPQNLSTVVRVEILNDSVFEGTEQFFGRLQSNGTVLTDSAMVQIRDDGKQVSMFVYK